MLTAVLSGLILAVALDGANVPCAICSGLALLLSLGLNVFTGQLDNLMQLRREVYKLHETNSKLKKSVEVVGEEVSRLQTLQVGLAQLRSKFGDNITAAREDIRLRQSLVTTAVGSTLTAIFKDMTTRKRKERIDPYDMHEFEYLVKQMFQDKQGFNVDALMKQISMYRNTGMDSESLLYIIGIVMNSEQRSHDMRAR